MIEYSFNMKTEMIRYYLDYFFNNIEKKSTVLKLSLFVLTF